tara:strand:+ start:391 stop:1368 length:978 start_codon:yes stop_codon:yes gene_type:complete
LDETKNKTTDKVTSDLKRYKNIAVSEAKQTRLLIRILMSSAKEYLKNKDFRIDKEDKEFIKDQSSDLLKLIPLIAFQIIPGSTIATPFIVKLGEKLGMKLNTKIPEKYKNKEEETTDGEMTELVDSDGTFGGSSIPILQLGMHPRKTQDQTVIATRQTNNPFVRGYRVFYGESVDSDDEKLLDEINMSDAFGYEETEDLETYDDADEVLQQMGIEDPFERNDRLETMGFDPKLDAQLKREKKRGICKNCFTKRRLSEVEKEKMIKMIDEILLKKKKNSEDVINKDGDDETPVTKILKRNLQSIKRIADKEGININQLIKILKVGE